MPKHKIETLRAKVARLEAEVAHEIYVELAILPKQFGFDSVADFLRAVKIAAKDSGIGPATPAKRAVAPKKRKKRKKRAPSKKAAAPKVMPAQMPVESMIPPA
jgi:hypothetical protein